MEISRTYKNQTIFKKMNKVVGILLPEYKTS